MEPLVQGVAWPAPRGGWANRSTGFTLVEVLVALVIMATMAMLAWRGIDALLRTRDIAQANLDHSTRLQAVMGQWEADLRALQDSGVVPALAFDGANLRLTRRQPQGLQMVVWSVRDGGLHRWAGPVQQTVAALQDSFLRSQQLPPPPDQPQPLRTLDGVVGWQVFFYRGNGWSNAQSSGDLIGSSSVVTPATPPASGASAPGPGAPAQQQRIALPSGVRMLLQFDADSSGFAGPLLRQIVLEPQP
ncbi:PulJ/GspJ family protein [Roseateles violae]|uniref:Prepilin-type N-terminal cleavage/methylation domain-containing protein n=1 Tax=Roseateles violae TaxID=3058042 RepID=A0ABT8DVS5_9BURK|nr:prepilin-type N-terminal cleavage/methylation domain-containing protein [Pelomonas sp. PFR6]MDN3921150.1 prepilin-type N-terminal cleavage/methylation domain-containing protein [Pelomonas sp. PFR6]